MVRCRQDEKGELLPPPAGEELLPPPAGGPPPSRREVFGEGNRESAECRRARDARPYNVAGNCNCEMCLQRRVASLQPSVAPPSPVGARIARPFISDVITTFREGARRVIGATAKPLYPIDGKAGGLDRRTPQTSLFEGGGPSADGGRSKRRRWKAFPTVEAVHHILPKIQFICFIRLVCPRHKMFSSKTVRCPSGECRDSRHGFSPNQRILKL